MHNTTNIARPASVATGRRTRRRSAARTAATGSSSPATPGTSRTSTQTSTRGRAFRKALQGVSLQEDLLATPLLLSSPSRSWSRRNLRTSSRRRSPQRRRVFATKSNLPKHLLQQQSRPVRRNFRGKGPQAKHLRLSATTQRRRPRCLLQSLVLRAQGNPSPVTPQLRRANRISSLVQQGPL